MEMNQSAMAKLAQLRSKLIGQKTTPGIVKFPMSTEEAALNIEVAFQVEVEKRGNTYVNSEELHNHIWQIACSPSLPTNSVLCCVVA